MSRDIVDRLRESCGAHGMIALDDLREAADLIEKIRHNGEKISVTKYWCHHEAQRKTAAIHSLRESTLDGRFRDEDQKAAVILERIWNALVN